MEGAYGMRERSFKFPGKSPGKSPGTAFGKTSGRRRRVVRGTVRATGLAGVMVLAAACTPWGLAGMAGINALTYLETDKFVSDHVLSSMLYKDCATLNILKTGKLCKEEKKPIRVAQAPVYCYRTLGNINCYATLDPYQSGARLVQWPTMSKSGPWLARRDPENEGN